MSNSVLRPVTITPKGFAMSSTGVVSPGGTSGFFNVRMPSIEERQKMLDGVNLPVPTIHSGPSPNTPAFLGIAPKRPVDEPPPEHPIDYPPKFTRRTPAKWAYDPSYPLRLHPKPISFWYPKNVDHGKWLPANPVSLDWQTLSRGLPGGVKWSIFQRFYGPTGPFTVIGRDPIPEDMSV